MPESAFDVEVIASSGASVMAVADGDVIYRRGEDCDCAYIVKSGRVELRQKGRAVEIVVPGEVFGEVGMIADAPRLEFAIAHGAVELVPIDPRTFAVLVRDDEDFALAIMRRLAERLRATTEVFELCVNELPSDVAVAPAPV